MLTTVLGLVSYLGVGGARMRGCVCGGHICAFSSKSLTSLLVLLCSSVCFSASRLFSRMVMAWSVRFLWCCLKSCFMSHIFLSRLLDSVGGVPSTAWLALSLLHVWPVSTWHVVVWWLPVVCSFVFILSPEEWYSSAVCLYKQHMGVVSCLFLRQCLHLLPGCCLQ